jgi:hypothetical protein
MQKQKLLLWVVVVATKVCASAQGTFQNLDFEQAKIIIDNAPALIAASDALPGWAVFADGVPLNEVQRDSVLFDGAGIADTPSALLIDGNFSAILAGPGLSSVPMSIAQSGTVPAGSESLRFLAGAPFLVSFAGHSIAIALLGPGNPNGLLYGGDISAYAGEYGQLVFQTYALSSGGVNPLDDISFSTQPIPEPGALSILFVGALMLSRRPRRRRTRSAAVRSGGCLSEAR